jgi:hypothetical protein
MGLINNGTYIATNGCEKKGTYISFNNEQVYIYKYNKDSVQYTVTANCRIYWDKSTRNSNKHHIDSQSILVNITESQLNQNPYTILYSVLKQKFPNSEDDITPNTISNQDTNATTTDNTNANIVDDANISMSNDINNITTNNSAVETNIENTTI